MSDFYERIKNLDLKENYVVITSLEESSLGEKRITSGTEEWKKSGIYTTGGKEYFVDLLGKEPELVVCGAGHVSIPVIQIGKMMKFHVTVLEDRPAFAENAEKAGADRVLCKSFEESLDEIEGDHDTYFVIVTRGHQYDQICLEHIMKKPHAYIGMMGSKRRVGIIRENLLNKGCDRHVLDSVYTPIGLDLGAETPAEIAVSIMAQIVKVRKEKGKSIGYPKEILEEILSHSEEKMVLSTILSREGSAPQGPGIKMLIKRDGSCVGTIGGGYMEAIVKKDAIDMMDLDEKAKICFVDLSNPKAGEEGMVCGGRLRVLLERIR